MGEVVFVTRNTVIWLPQTSTAISRNVTSDGALSWLPACAPRKLVQAIQYAQRQLKLYITRTNVTARVYAVLPKSATDKCCARCACGRVLYPPESVAAPRSFNHSNQNSRWPKFEIRRIEAKRLRQPRSHDGKGKATQRHPLQVCSCVSAASRSSWALFGPAVEKGTREVTVRCRPVGARRSRAV